ncbi:nuclear transport factor 2 family protein [Arthrobacter sp. NPDC055138]
MDAKTAAWITAYRRAWETNDPDQIGALFATDAEYRPDPWTAPWRGRDAIVREWLARKDEPGAATFEWREVAVADGVSVVEGTTVYREGPTYSNLWVIRLDGQGQATHFTEWWMDQSTPS